MNKLRKIQLDCRHATSLIERRQFTPLTLKEKCQLYFHLAGCTMCRLFRRQSHWINRLLHNLADNPDADDRGDMPVDGRGPRSSNPVAASNDPRAERNNTGPEPSNPGAGHNNTSAEPNDPDPGPDNSDSAAPLPDSPQRKSGRQQGTAEGIQLDEISKREMQRKIDERLQ